MFTNIEQISKVTVINVGGRLTSATLAQMQEDILQAAKTSTCILLDMSQVNFLSSAGLRMLLLIYRHIGENHGKIALSGLTEHVHDVMSITGFLDLFTVYYNRAEGIENLERAC